MTTTAELTHDAVLDAALQEFDGSQAELARSLEVAQSSISRWRARKSRPEVESALIIARLTGLPRSSVLEAFGHDPLKLGLLDAQGTAPDNGSQLRELGRMLRPQSM
jgi:transcriptional regulator with XRE-family HTH domain